MISDQPAPALAPARGRTVRNALILGVVAFLAGIAALGFAIRAHPEWFARWIAPAETMPVTTAQQTRPSAMTNATMPPPTLDTLAAREAALGARLSAIEARTATVSSDADAAAGNATRAEGLLIAFAARRALDRGLGLGYIEGQLRDRFGATQPRAVATIISASRAPVTIEDLRGGLAAIASDLMTNAHQDGWWATIRHQLANLVVVHEESAPSTRPTDRLDRARRLLEGGQVEAALAEVTRLPGADKAQAWTSAARRYIDARHALDTIETAAIIGQAREPQAAVPTQPDPTQPVADTANDAGAQAPAPDNGQ